ncbi:MAG: hypothetical protein U5L72_02655 [Bacteroidales bacterium]|nr:hypothetical protein [Bacteroidales bacterium]
MQEELSGSTLSRNLTMGNGVEPFDLEVHGIVDNYGNINTSANPGAAIRFHDNSLYNHRLNGGTIPESTWLTNSTCEVLIGYKHNSCRTESDIRESDPGIVPVRRVI